MMIAEVTSENLREAAYVHAEAFEAMHNSNQPMDSQRSHSIEAHAGYICQRMRQGRRFFLLTEHEPLGIVGVEGNVISDLYVLPEKQCKGWGTKLLRHAMTQCSGRPVLWVLNTNIHAQKLYIREGFMTTGKIHRVSASLFEIQMEYRGENNR